MARRLAALGLAVLVLALGGSAVAPQRSPIRHTGLALAMAPTPRIRVSGRHPYGPPPIPVPAPAVPHGTGPSGSLRTTGSAAVALTFDDGPGGWTPAVLDLLAQYHIKATFCLIGRQVTGYAQVVRRIVAEGHTLCNHTWDHDLLLRTRTPDRIRAEMQSTNDAIHAVVPGVPIRYFRNPGGEYSPQTVGIAASLGMTSLYWNVDPQDWRKPGMGPIIGNVLGHTGPGAIVLLHDGGGDRSETLAALRVILPNLVHRYQLIPLPV